MKTRKILFNLLLIVLVLTACAPAATIVPASERVGAADPAQVVQKFWDAYGKNDLDSAMAFVAEDVECRGSCYFSGAESFRAYVQGTMDSGAVITISNLQVDNDKVTYDWIYFRNGNLQWAGTDSMQVENGRIIYWNNIQQ